MNSCGCQEAAASSYLHSSVSGQFTTSIMLVFRHASHLYSETGSLSQVNTSKLDTCNIIFHLLHLVSKLIMGRFFIAFQKAP